MIGLPAQLPERVDAGGLTFVPLTPRLLVDDYSAVMRDVAMLRAWSGQDWPTDEFSIEDDLVDLERHDREQREGVALTYSVLRDETLIGCIYVRPMFDALATRSVAPDPESLASGDIVVRGWAHEVSAVHLIDAARKFLCDPPFRFPQLWWQTNTDCVDQLAACGALGLTKQLTFETNATTWVLATHPGAL